MTAATAEHMNTEKYALTLTRTFDAPRELVFAAWTKPEHLVRWWGPRGCTIPQCDLDVKKGGKWSTTMRHENNEENRVQGEYLEISQPDRLVFTWAWQYEDGPGHETTVSVTFEEQGGKTVMKFHQEMFQEEEYRNLHEQGWNSSFECLIDFLAE